VETGADSTKPCIVCGGIALLRARAFGGFQEPMQFDVFHCTRCFAAFCDPLEVVEEIYDRIYEDPASIPGYDRYLRYEREVTREKSPLRYLADSEDIYWGIAQLLPAIEGASGSVRVLDVGCGLGYLTFALKSAGYEAVGVDLSDKAVATARQHFGGDYRSTTLHQLSESGEQFDAVVMAELIEHVVDPVSLVRDGLRVLSEGGRLIITTPNRSAYGPDVVWTGDRPPVHLWWLSEQSIRAIAQTFGCDVDFVDYSRFNEIHPAPMAGGWCKPSVGKPGLDAHGTASRITLRAQTLNTVVRAAVEASRAVGLAPLGRRLVFYLLGRNGDGWVTGPRRMTMAASLARRSSE
jgi:SAM-dependent methyltransferase